MNWVFCAVRRVLGTGSIAENVRGDELEKVFCFGCRSASPRNVFAQHLETGFGVVSGENGRVASVDNGWMRLPILGLELEASEFAASENAELGPSAH